jgi:hypothetical protein
LGGSVANHPKFLPQNTKVAGKNISGRSKLQPICRKIGEKGADRVANVGEFSPKNANSGIFGGFGELGDF